MFSLKHHRSYRKALTEGVCTEKEQRLTGNTNTRHDPTAPKVYCHVTSRCLFRLESTKLQVEFSHLHVCLKADQCLLMLLHPSHKHEQVFPSIRHEGANISTVTE